MALTATVAGDSSNSYVSLAEADAYFADHWSTAKVDVWSELSSPQKERILIAATQVLESLRVLDAEYGGGSLPPALTDGDSYDVVIHRYKFDQRLQFPRNVDLSTSNVAFIPQEVKDAQCEQAVYLFAFDDSQISTQLQGVMEEAIAAGGVRVYTQYNRRGNFVAPMAVQFLLPFLRKTRRMPRA